MIRGLSNLLFRWLFGLWRSLVGFAMVINVEGKASTKLQKVQHRSCDKAGNYAHWFTKISHSYQHLPEFISSISLSSDYWWAVSLDQEPSTTEAKMHEMTCNKKYEWPSRVQPCLQKMTEVDHAKRDDALHIVLVSLRTGEGLNQHKKGTIVHKSTSCGNIKTSRGCYFHLPPNNMNFHCFCWWPIMGGDVLL